MGNVYPRAPAKKLLPLSVRQGSIIEQVPENTYIIPFSLVRQLGFCPSPQLVSQCIGGHPQNPAKELRSLRMKEEGKRMKEMGVWAMIEPTPLVSLSLILHFVVQVDVLEFLSFLQSFQKLV